LALDAIALFLFILPIYPIFCQNEEAWN